jgi:hypothetical protein
MGLDWVYEDKDRPEKDGEGDAVECVVITSNDERGVDVQLKELNELNNQ